MGDRVRAAVDEADDAILSGALEAAGHPRIGDEIAPGVRLVDDAAAALGGADVAIDFTLPRVTCAVVRVAAERGVAYVCGTTGLSASDRAELEAAAQRIPIVLAPNFSVAVNVLAHLVGEATRLLGPSYDVEIVELHHGAKRDAPSGTALRLAEAVADARGEELRKRLVASRDGETGARPAQAIGVQALRGGDNPGEHTVLFLGRGERLELIHRAATRDHFAVGALRAARWLRGRAPGLYTMQQVLGLETG
ncbi:MAG: 4-hydroxy-tetrahydrodipicolinate reductase [Proteobacteria bacterium]|nr:MAG: 4-hydroxy-tetrahydrodipicolinate reductase [Pseudomonadota bacterium]